MQYEIMGSAYGGGMGHDGASATATHLSNLHITPIEILEVRVSLPHHPVRSACPIPAAPAAGAAA